MWTEANAGVGMQVVSLGPGRTKGPEGGWVRRTLSRGLAAARAWGRGTAAVRLLQPRPSLQSGAGGGGARRSSPAHGRGLKPAQIIG